MPNNASIHLRVATKLAYKAGDIMRTNFSLGMQRKWKEDDSPITITDTAINQLVIDEIKKEFPGHAILGEEDSYKITNSEYVWVCDPVDGTIPFSHGIPVFAFSLALTKNGQCILGIVYDPILDRLYYAEKGNGTFLNSQKVSVSKKNDLKHALIDVVWWKTAPYNISSLTNTLEEHDAFPVRLKSYVYGAALTACGEASAAIFAGKTPWDVAAIKIIIEEAGGRVTDLFGNEQRYDTDVKGVLASNGALHDQILKLISSAIS